VGCRRGGLAERSDGLRGPRGEWGGERCVSLFCGVVGYCHGLFLLLQLRCARWGEVLRCIRCWVWEDGYLRGLEADDQREDVDGR